MKIQKFSILTIGIALLLVTFGLFGGVLVKHKLESSLVSNYTQEETLIGHQIADTLHGRIQNLENSFEILALNPVLQTGSPQTCTNLFQQVKTNTMLYVNNLVRVNSQGIFTCSLTNPNLLNTPVSKLGNYWQQLQQDPNHAPVLSHVIARPNVPDLAIAMHVPMYDSNHHFIGTVGGAFYLKQLASNYLDTVKFAKTGYASLQDDDGTILYSHLPGLTGKNYFSPAFQTKTSDLTDLNRAVLAARKGKSSIVEYTNLYGEHKVASVVPVMMLPGHRWIIIVNVPIKEISQAYVTTGLNQAFTVLTVIFCVAVLLFSMLMIANSLHDARLKRTEDQFISLVSHQLRTPLTAIRLFSEMLLAGQVGTLAAKQADYVDKIHISAIRMIQLVGEILNVSRVELNKLSIKPQPSDINKLIISYIDEVQPLASEKQITLEFSNSSTYIVSLDETLFGQVVHNLLTNAIRYGKPASTVSIRLTKQSNGYILCITDQGIGISKKARKHIFERFYRADNAVSAVGEGTGLGLYLVKMILEQSSCNIRFESEENKGTTFYVTIPLDGMRARLGDKQLESTTRRVK